MNSTSLHSHFRTALFIVLLILISVPLILPYFHNGYFPTHDGEWAVVRSVEMFRELRDLQIPPRYSGALNFGYGYPLFNFAYPLPYYLSVILHLFGFSFVDSIKILFAASVPLSAVTMFFLGKKLWRSDFAGILSAIFYIYVPYRMLDLYVRGSLGESLSFVLYPLIAYLLLRFVKDKELISGILAAIGFSALITTHNIMAVYYMLLLGLFFVFAYVSGARHLVKPFIFFGILSFGIAAFFWMPALFEKSNILLSQIPIADRNLYYVSLSELFAPIGVSGISPDLNRFPYQIGIAQIMLFIVFASYILMMFKNKKFLIESRSIFIFLSAALIILFFLLFPFSRIVWENTPLLKEINYPWTLLGPIGFITSLTAGILIKGKIERILLLAIGCIAIITVIPIAKPERYVDRGDIFYISNDATTTSSNELMPLWVKELPRKLSDKKVLVEKDGTVISGESFTSKNFTFTLIAQSQEKVIVNKIYYPGWNIQVNGKPIDIDYDNRFGVMSFVAPVGESRINGYFKETPLRLISDVITIISTTIIGIILWKRKYIKKILFT